MKLQNKINGYEIKKRSEKEAFSGDKIIYWWTTRDEAIKCDGYSPLGYFAFGLGDDLEKSLESIFFWFKDLDEDDEENQVEIGDLIELLKDFDKDLKIKIKTDCGVLCIDSIDCDNETIYINTHHR